MLNVVIVVVAVLLGGYLAFSKRLGGSSSWQATVTPLASIMGSGFLVSAPLLAGIVGNLAVFADKTIFDFFVYVVTQVIMPTGGILVAVFAGWVVKRQVSADELFNGEEPLVYKVWLFIMRFIAPILLAMVLYDVATQ